MNYADTITEVLRKEASHQPSLLPIRVAAVCDVSSGHFLLVASGWEKKRRVETILFHARLVEGKVVIEDDNFEDGLTALLIEAGIAEADILTALAFERTRQHSPGHSAAA
jgi:hypothetical protein